MRTNTQRGSVVPIVVAMMGVLGMTAAGLCAATALVVGHRQAQAAADLAAIAAATTLTTEDPCTAARAVAEANGAVLSDCTPDATGITVEVTVSAPDWLGERGPLRAEARAGYIPDDP